MPIPPIQNWKNVFLDTSTIIDYLKNAENCAKNPTAQDAVLTTQKIINTLAAKQGGKEVRIQFYISAITLAELPRIANDESSFRRVVRAFNYADITVLDYTKRIAEQTEINLKNAITDDGESRKYVKRMEQARREIDNFNARGWISDDLKILMTAKNLPNLDVILTSDKNTFLPIAEKLNLPCLATYNDFLPTDLFGDLDTTLPI